MIILTDGSDTQGSSYPIMRHFQGAGRIRISTRLDWETRLTRMSCRQLGNAGFFHITDVSKLSAQLTAQFIEIQSRIASFADSFYWLKYLSPKRGDRYHELELSVKEESDSILRFKGNSTVGVSVLCARVYMSTIRRVPIPILRESRGTAGSHRGDTVRLQAVTYLRAETPQYIWESSNSDYSRDRASLG